jgi:hypothetical protein
MHGSRVPRVGAALVAAVVAGGFGLVPFGMTWARLGVLSGLVFVLWLVIGLRRAAVAVGLLKAPAGARPARPRAAGAVGDPAAHAA